LRIRNWTQEKQPRALCQKKKKKKKGPVEIKKRSIKVGGRTVLQDTVT
jgi:hypothetical protein